jgi:hypothetical protein
LSKIAESTYVRSYWGFNSGRLKESLGDDELHVTAAWAGLVEETARITIVKKAIQDFLMVNHNLLL